MSEVITYITHYPEQWLLAGVHQSAQLDNVAAGAVSLGLDVRFVRPGGYRVQGTVERLGHLRKWVEGLKSDVTLEFEAPPAKPVTTVRLAAQRQFQRTVEVHGCQSQVTDKAVARALDARLSVNCVGLGRFEVTGTSSHLVAWLALVWEVDRAAALAELGATEDHIAAEDSATPPIVVQVALPVRETSSLITRDSSGSIISVIQTERDVPPATGEGAE